MKLATSLIWTRAICCVCAFMPGCISACPEFEASLEAGQVESTTSSAGIGQLWTGGQFVYAFSPDIEADPSKVRAFEQACAELLGQSALKCTRLTEAPSAIDYVFVMEGGHDFSYVGRQGGCQALSILTWTNPHIIAHEIKHALGWNHEQQHPDRDAYITILWDNIPSDYQAEFEIQALGNEGPYDPDSIMHFYPSDFARPGMNAFRSSPGAIELPITIGQRDHFSQTDLDEIRLVYGPSSTQ